MSLMNHNIQDEIMNLKVILNVAIFPFLLCAEGVLNTAPSRK